MLITEFVDRILSEIEKGIAHFNARPTKIDANMPEYVDFELNVNVDKISDCSRSSIRVADLSYDEINTQKMKFRIYCEYHRLKNT